MYIWAHIGMYMNVNMSVDVQYVCFYMSVFRCIMSDVQLMKV